jgi:thioredoxin-like negative regulator of GroEL
MALSSKVNEEILEAKSHLRNALKYASMNEKVFVCKFIADTLINLENLEKAENIIDKLENRNPGDSGIFGSFFNDI